MRASQWKLAAAALALSAVTLPALANGPSESSVHSATVARDVNGFRLGMPLEEARKLAELEYIGGDQFEATGEGFQYNFGVTPKGRIYRVQSSQSLGQFSLDRTFLQTLKLKLSAKYGPPISEHADVFGWEVIENVMMADGKTTPFRIRMGTPWLGFISRHTSETHQQFGAARDARTQAVDYVRARRIGIECLVHDVEPRFPASDAFDRKQGKRADRRSRCVLRTCSDNDQRSQHRRVQRVFHGDILG